MFIVLNSCLFFTDEEAAASKRLVTYAFSAQTNLLTSFFTTFACLHRSFILACKEVLSFFHLIEQVESLAAIS